MSSPCGGHWRPLPKNPSRHPSLPFPRRAAAGVGHQQGLLADQDGGNGASLPRFSVAHAQLAGRPSPRASYVELGGVAAAVVATPADARAGAWGRQQGSYPPPLVPSSRSLVTVVELAGTADMRPGGPDPEPWSWSVPVGGFRRQLAVATSGCAGMGVVAGPLSYPPPAPFLHGLAGAAVAVAGYSRARSARALWGGSGWPASGPAVAKA